MGKGRKTFQSTPPVRGATTFCPLFPAFTSLFQSTPPVRGATVCLYASYMLS